eukprot:scaffold5946_cov114-Isochrysis_galbana.AAC.6
MISHRPVAPVASSVKKMCVPQPPLRIGGDSTRARRADASPTRPLYTSSLPAQSPDPRRNGQLPPREVPAETPSSALPCPAPVCPATAGQPGRMAARTLGGAMPPAASLTRSAREPWAKPSSTSTAGAGPPRSRASMALACRAAKRTSPAAKGRLPRSTVAWASPGRKRAVGSTPVAC